VFESWLDYSYTKNFGSPKSMQVNRYSTRALQWLQPTPYKYLVTQSLQTCCGMAVVIFISFAAQCPSYSTKILCLLSIPSDVKPTQLDGLLVMSDSLQCNAIALCSARYQLKANSCVLIRFQNSSVPRTVTNRNKLLFIKIKTGVTVCLPLKTRVL
jgi:hypothetical protein